MASMPNKKRKRKQPLLHALSSWKFISTNNLFNSMGHNYKFLVHNQFHYVFIRKMMFNSCVFSKFMERTDKSNSALGKSCSVLKIIVASSEITFLYSPKVFDGSP